MANSDSMTIDTAKAVSAGQQYVTQNSRLDSDTAKAAFKDSLKNFSYGKSQTPGLQDDVGNSEYDIYSMNYYQHNQYLPYNFAANTNTDHAVSNNDSKNPAPVHDNSHTNSIAEPNKTANSDAPNRMDKPAQTIEHRAANNNKSADETKQANENKSSSDNKTVDNNSQKNITEQKNVNSDGQQTEINSKAQQNLSSNTIPIEYNLNLPKSLNKEGKQSLNIPVELISKTSKNTASEINPVITKGVQNILQVGDKVNITANPVLNSKNNLDLAAKINNTPQNNDLAVNQLLQEMPKSLSDLNPAMVQDLQRIVIKTTENNPKQVQSINNNDWFANAEKQYDTAGLQASAETQAKGGDSSFNNPLQGKQTNTNSNGFAQMLNLANTFEGKGLSFGESLSKTTASLKENTTMNLKMTELVQNTLNMVKSMPGNSTQVARIFLKPPELGSVFVEISLNNNIAKINLQADSKEVVKSIQAQLEMLKDKLSQQGIKTESINVNLKPNDYELAERGYSYNNKKNKDDIEAQEAFVRSFGNGTIDNSNNEEDVPSLIENINKGYSLEKYI